MPRDRGFLVQLVLSCVVVACAWGVTRVLAGPQAAVWALAWTGAAAVVFLAVTWWRCRRIAELARRVDQALSGKREVSFMDMREGELEVLSNEVDKAVTRLAIANDDLRREKVQLADALADISHQLRTPLTSLGLELELARKAAGTPAQREHLVGGERLVERVQWLVSALLKLARLDAGVVQLSRQRVDVAELAATSAAPLAVPFDLADVALVVQVAEGTSFMGDAAWTREALANVLKNCLEHTPVGGEVRLAAWEDAVACRIRVEDTGPGISERDLPHVFERFYHGEVEGEDQVNPAGVGIGLSLARALVVAQGGQVTASNATDEHGVVRGARFDLTFFKVIV